MTFKDQVKRIELPDDYWEAVIEGMWAVNAGGTASGSALRDPETGFEMCGKTGTAQVVSKLKASKLEERDHSWFVGFGPREKPEIAAISLVEHGGFGAKASAPNVRAVFEVWLRKKKGLPVQVGAAEAPGPVRPAARPTPRPQTPAQTPAR